MIESELEAEYAAAYTHLQAGNLKAALDGFRHIVRQVPSHGPAQYHFALVLLATGRNSDAAGHFQQAIQLGAGTSDAWDGLMLALLRGEHYSNADRVLAECEQLGVSTPNLKLNAARLQAIKNAPLRLNSTPRVLTGSRAGLRQSLILAPVVLLPVSESAVLGLHAYGEQLLRTELPLLQSETSPLLAQSVLNWAIALQFAAGHPVYDLGCCLAGPEPTLGLPYDDSESALAALRWSVRIHAAFLGSAPELHQDLLAQLMPETDIVMRAIRQRAPTAGTIRHLLAAAHAGGLPWQRLSPHSFVYRIGQGASSRLLQSTMTDSTPAIGVQLAKNKLVSLDLLRQLGLPVPRHALATDAEAAVRIAEQIVYPVVVKPLQLDQGRGVSVNLRSSDAVRQAFARATQEAPNALVEAFLPGRDYRFLVMGGRLIFAIERIPGGLTGDGRSMITELLAAINADPLRGEDERKPLRRIPLDAEALALLEEQGLQPEDVPKAGDWVRLRRIANVGQGGVPVRVPLDSIHPENRRLAERAAKALALDIAGIDFLTPDIESPWYEVGGGICEVNAQPSIGVMTAKSVFPEILDWLLAGGDGRIPLILLCGNPERVDALALALHSHLLDMGLNAGMANSQGAWIGAERICRDARCDIAGARLLLGNSEVQAAVLACSAIGLAQGGLPVDRCNLAVWLSTSMPSPIEIEFLQLSATVILPLELQAALEPMLAGQTLAVSISSEASASEQNEDFLAAILKAFIESANITTSAKKTL